MNAFRRPLLSAVATPPVMKRNPAVLLAALCTALLLLPAGHALAQANAKPPTQLTYQGFLTDGNGVPFGNTTPVNKTVYFRIYDALTGGAIKWSSQQVVTVDKGYFSALLGQGSSVGTEPFSADLTGVFTGSSTVSDRYLELTADGTTIAPRLRFLPAPYALLAKSATDLVDPVTGSNSLAIAGGNLTSGGTVTATSFNGSGANLTSLNGANLTAGSVADSKLATITTGGKVANSATTATPANAPGTIVGRDGSGNFAAGTVTATSFSGSGASLTSLNASQISSGTLDNARTTATSANTANAIVARDGSGNITAGQVVANSFKINGTTTLVLYNVSRFSMLNPVPPAGVSQSVNSGTVGRNSVTIPADWYKSTSTTWGIVAYACTFVVPAGEVWEVNYHCNARWSTDDQGGLVWTVNDVLTDDSSATRDNRSTGQMYAGQNFILSAGTSVVRVKIGVGGGSGSDDIEFPYRNPSYCVVKKYKSN